MDTTVGGKSSSVKKQRYAAHEELTRREPGDLELEKEDGVRPAHAGD